MKKQRDSISLPPPRVLQVKPGDVFARLGYDLVVVATAEATLTWADPPEEDKMPAKGKVAVRNSHTGRLSVMQTSTLQIERARVGEARAIVALVELASALGRKVISIPKPAERKTEASR